VTVIPHGIEEWYRVLSAADRDRARARWQLPADGTRRVLVVGSSYYKNVTTAVRAFDILRRRVDSVQLVGVGVEGPEWNQTVVDLGLTSCARAIGPVQSGEMVEIYNCVDVLLFPSLYEGFGRPPVEAMACGVPVVASNAAALPEAVGDAGLMSPACDADAMADNLVRVLQEDGLRQGLIARGLERRHLFTWPDNARRTAAVYRRALATSGRMVS
jgi:glycosyltransferase involved in cell wall biosynthesis